MWITCMSLMRIWESTPACRLYALELKLLKWNMYFYCSTFDLSFWPLIYFQSGPGNQPPGGGNPPYNPQGPMMMPPFGVRVMVLFLFLFFLIVYHFWQMLPLLFRALYLIHIYLWITPRNISSFLFIFNIYFYCLPFLTNVSTPLSNTLLDTHYFYLWIIPCSIILHCTFIVVVWISDACYL